MTPLLVSFFANSPIESFKSRLFVEELNHEKAFKKKVGLISISIVLNWLNFLIGPAFEAQFSPEGAILSQRMSDFVVLVLIMIGNLLWFLCDTYDMKYDKNESRLILIIFWTMNFLAVSKDSQISTENIGIPFLHRSKQVGLQRLH